MEFFPTFASMAEAPPSILFDLTAFRRVRLGRARSLTIRVVESDDSDRGWDGEPRRGGKNAKRSSGRRTNARPASLGKRSGRRCRAGKKRP